MLGAQSGLACLRRGLKALPNHSDLLWNLAEQLLRGGETEEAGKIVTQLRRRGFNRVLLDYLSARAALARKQWLGAAAALERLVTPLMPWPELTWEANLLLGRCYGQLGDADRQYTAFRRVVTADPLSVPGCLGLGSALAALGKTKEALQIYRRVLPGLPAVGVLVARLLILQNLSLPASQRDWKTIDRLLDAAERSAPDVAAVVVLRAESLVSQGKFQKAFDLVAAARDRKPKQVGLWTALAALAGRRGKPADALQILDRAEKQLGDRIELRLARLTRIAHRASSKRASRSI